VVGCRVGSRVKCRVWSGEGGVWRVNVNMVCRVWSAGVEFEAVFVEGGAPGSAVACKGCSVECEV
jgi:hypothetical protein